MKDTISCEIVKDLLPNCIEDIVSKDSKKLVSEHLKNCDCCKKEWENMNSLMEGKPVGKIKINYLKRIHNKAKTILFICLALTVFSSIISIFLTDTNCDEAILTLVFTLFALTIIIVKLLPLFGLVLSFWLFIRTKKKWAKIIWLIILVLFTFICLYLYIIRI
ncbi:hypothetical protein [Clostridium sp. DL1XJH146]